MMLPMQPGDVPATYAEVDDLEQDTGFKPGTSLETGVGLFVRWYREHYHEDRPRPILETPSLDQ